MAKKNVTERTSDDGAELEAVYQGVLQCESAIHADDVEKLAAIVKNNQRMGIPWRLTAVIASKDGEFFRDVAENEETAKTLVPVIDLLSEFAELLRKVADLADCASTRLMVAGCNHEDFNKWMKEAA